MQANHDLINRARGGDHSAFLALIALYDRQLMSVIYRFSADLYDREDLYQEIFLHTWKSLGSFSFRSTFQTWLYRLALNRCLAYMKKREPVAEVEDQEGASQDWEKREKLRVIHKALARLKGPQRVCFHLYYIEDWDPERIAETMNMKQGTVKSHLNRARDKIRNTAEVMEWR